MRSEFNIRNKRLIGHLVCAIGFSLMLWSFYPGMVSGDAIASLTEGRTGIIYDQNSAIMSYVWGILDRLVAGPGVMLLLQLGIFWSAAAMLWEAV